LTRQSLVVAALFCACEPTTVAPVARVATTTVTQPEGPVVVAPAADPTPFHHDADVALKFVPRKFKKTRVPLLGSSAGLFSPDGTSYVVDARTTSFTGAAIVNAAHPDGVKIASAVHEAGFSAHGKWLYLLDDDTDTVTVVDADGVVHGKWPEAFVARFVGDDELLFWKKCRLMRVDLTHPAAPPVPVGPEMCGAADASDDGKTWLVAAKSTYPVMVSTRAYTHLHKIDAATGAVTAIAIGSHEAPVSDIRLSPLGERVCLRMEDITCFDVRSSVTAIPKPSGDPFSLRWDVSGQQFLSTAAGDLVWVDLRTRLVRTVGLHTDIREWGFFPDGKRIYAYDRGAWIVDLSNGETVEVYPKEVTVGVFVPSPKGDRFLVTRVVSPSEREVDLVEPE
jgi:hypothetical protein